MKRGYRNNNILKHINFARTGSLAEFTDMLGMTSGNESRRAHSTGDELFSNGTPVSNVTGVQKVGRAYRTKNRPATSAVNYPSSKCAPNGTGITTQSMSGRNNGVSLPASGQMWRGARPCAKLASFAALVSDADAGRNSDPYKGSFDGGAGNMAKKLEAGNDVMNPYNLVNVKHKRPVRGDRKTPIKTLTRGSL